MIVGSRFDGDHNDVLMWAQHDVYDAIMAHMFLAALEYYDAHIEHAWTGPEHVYAARRRWEQQTGLDHRCLQEAHDLVAAFFRYAFASRCVVDGLPPGLDAKEHWKVLWSQYYPTECRRLAQNRAIADAILGAIAYQNTDGGYAAEDALAGLLKREYAVMLGGGADGR